MIKYKFILTIIIFSIFGVIQIIVAESVSFKDIVQHIRENEFEAYQTIILHDGENQSIEVQAEILQATFSNGPSRVINFIDHDSKKLKSIASKNYHKGTLFIGILENNTTTIDKFFDFVKIVSGPYTFPRCLMIILMNENSGSREALLRTAWSRNFVQFTILDVVKKNFGRNLMFDPNQRNIIIHYFNKFTQNYTMINYVKGDVIFPTKLKDLNGFEIKTCTDSETKQEYEERKLKVYLEGNPNTIYRFNYFFEPPKEFEEEKLNTFSKVMNFNRVRVHPDDCIKKNVNITMYLTCDNVLHDYSNENVCQISEKENNNQNIDRFQNYVYFLKTPHQQFLVPKKRIDNYMFTKSIYQGALTFLLVIVIWKFLQFLKFNKQFWQLWNIWLSLLGLLIPSDLKQLSDRIVFMSIFLGFFMLSSELHNLLTTVQLVIDYEDVFLDSEFFTNWSMRELGIGVGNHASNVFTLHHKYKNLPFKESDGLHHNVEECLKELFAYKAVACKVHINDIRKLLLMDSKINKISTIKIFQRESIKNLYFAVENNSPYTSEFERHMNRFIETGLFVKWDKENFKTNLNYSMIEDIILSNKRNDEINISTFHILLIGLGISIIAFLGEISTARVQKVWKCIQRRLMRKTPPV